VEAVGEEARIEGGGRHGCCRASRGLCALLRQRQRERERGLGNRPNALVFSDISQIPLQFSCSIFLCI
jgi:hypothetical protein